MTCLYGIMFVNIPDTERRSTDANRRVSDIFGAFPTSPAATDSVSAYVEYAFQTRGTVKHLTHDPTPESCTVHG